MKNNLEYRGVIRLCLLYIFFLVPPPYFAHFPHGHCFKDFTIPEYQQQLQISGTITDSFGPMAGVHIQVKGSNTGTFSNQKGEYSLTVNNNDTLIFSYLGYHSRELPILGRTNLDVQMQSEVTELQEVEVNAGYYTVKEKERTGSISRVTAKEIELQPIVSPLEALQGRMAGVEILPSGNLPGMASTIQIRGRNSLRNDGNFPLYIIDGVPLNSSPVNSNSLLGNPGPGTDPLNNLNLSNIASIEVLKDADATAIYGSRGANGVVLITTKKGTQRKTGIEARVYSGMATVPNRLKLLNTEEYLQIRNKAFENDGVEPTASRAYDLLVWDQERYTDWQDVFFGGTASIRDINIAASGGNATTSFRLGGSYHEQGTVYPGDYDYNKITTGLNLDHVSENKKFRLNFSTNFGLDVNNLVGNVSLTSQAFRLPPNAPKLFNEDGSLYWKDWESVGLKNPLEGYFNLSRTQAVNLVSNMGISYQLAKNLNVRTNLGYTYYNSEEMVKIPKRSYSPSNWENIDHQSIFLRSKRNSWIIEPQLVYGGKIGNVKLDALFGGTFQQSENGTLGVQGRGYVSENLIGNLGAAESIINASNSNTEYRYTALFGRLGLNWQEKYLINLTGRRDGSSRFGPEKRFANFWALGGAWIFSEEPLVKDHLSFLSFGKLRGSYGTTGSDQIGDYGYLDAYETTPGPGGLYPTQLTNPAYSWEVNKKLEVAGELGFIKDRIHLGLSWYRNRSSNQLVGYPLPTTTGFTSIQANLPATVQNRGWEVELATLNVKGKNFRWQTFLNVSLPENKLLSFPDLEQSSYANTFRVGHPLNISLLYDYDGIDPDTGYYKIVDINEDGRYDYEDRSVIRDLGKEYYGGINNTIGYKGFSLQFLLEFVKQDGTLSGLSAGSLSNQNVQVLGALDEDGRFQRISQTSQASRAYTYVTNTMFPVVDASYIRLRTLSLGYTLPTEVTKTIGITVCRLFLTGQNLLTITNYDGMDPEMPSGGTSFSGLRTITCGLQLNF
jgi:TonB-linked SusC/RagA family outer membrane protein